MNEWSIFTALYNERPRDTAYDGSPGGSPSIELPKAAKGSLIVSKGMRAQHFPVHFLSSRADKINAVIISNWVRNDKKAAARLRGALRYNQERERGHDEKERAFYTGHKEKLDRDDIRGEIRDKFGKDVAFHTVIFSPGDNNIDLKDFTRETMDAWQQELGYRLDYYAIEHKNTEHYHAHVIVPASAVGRAGDVRFGRQDLNNLREIANDFIARERMIDRAFDRALAREFGFDKQERYDRELQNVFHMSFKNYRQDQEAARLSTLADFTKAQKELGLAQVYDFSGKEWQFDHLYSERSEENTQEHSWDREMTPVFYGEQPEENTAQRSTSNTKAINEAMAAEDERERDDDDDENRRHR